MLIEIASSGTNRPSGQSQNTARSLGQARLSTCCCFEDSVAPDIAALCLTIGDNVMPGHCRVAELVQYCSSSLRYRCCNWVQVPRMFKQDTRSYAQQFADIKHETGVVCVGGGGRGSLGA